MDRKGSGGITVLSTPAKATFDMLYPSGVNSYDSHSFLNNFLALYQCDFLPLRPLGHDNPDMRVMVLGTDVDNYQRGVYYGNNSQRISLTSGDSPVMGAPVSNPRIDIVYVNSNGSISVASGTEASSPSIPDISSSGDRFPVCAVYHRLGTSKIVNYSEKDAYTGDSYIAYDLRPFYSISRSDSGSDEEYRNTKNIMYNVLLEMQYHSMGVSKMIDGWNDDCQNNQARILSTRYSGDLVSGGDKLRYTRNIGYNGTPNFNFIPSGTTVDGRKVLVAGLSGDRVGFDFQATRANLVLVSKSGETWTAEITRNSGTTWNSIPLDTDFYDGTYYYRSGKNEALSGSYFGSNTGDYFLTFILPSGLANSTIEAYGVCLA